MMLSMVVILILFLSTLSLRRATHDIPEQQRRADCISIHALLTESDASGQPHSLGVCHFYPRSPYGERLISAGWLSSPKSFLSTLSLRRATGVSFHDLCAAMISIHALLTESDRNSGRPCRTKWIFLSTLSLRRATFSAGRESDTEEISIHAIII